jgi:hypothetical protein
MLRPRCESRECDLIGSAPGERNPLGQRIAGFVLIDLHWRQIVGRLARIAGIVQDEGTFAQGRQQAAGRVEG